MRKPRRTLKRVRFFAAVLVAVNVITLLFMAPLNSLILVSPSVPVCVSCLLTLYGGGILAVSGLLVLVSWWGGEHIAVRSYKTLSVAGLVSFLHLIQVTSVSHAWRTPYVIVCIVVFAPPVIGFLRAERSTVILVHQFFVILFLYEILNVGRVMVQARSLDTRIASAHAREAGVGMERAEKAEKVKQKGHVFWLVFDEFSLVHALQGKNFNADVVPNLAAFSRESTWYSHARTLYPWTPQAIAALLLGKKEVSGFSDVFLTNFNSQNYLSSMARTMEVFIVGAYMPYCLSFRQVTKGCLDFPGGFSDYRRLAGHVWDRAIPGMLRNNKGGVGLERLVARQFDPEPVIAFALKLGQSFDHPTFTYIHEGLPHFPYQFKRDGSVTFLGYGGGPSNSLNPNELEAMRKDYRNQIAYVDSLFGEFIAKLKAGNLYDRSFIVVMSDHGTSFDPPNLGRPLEHEQVSRVPFLIRSPGQTQGEVNPSPVHTAEFFEVLLERMAQGAPRASLSAAERW